MNNEMNSLLRGVNEIKNDELKISIKTLNNILLPNFIEVDDIILLRLLEDKIPKSIDLQNIKNVYGDKTSYETSCNEFYVNKYLDYEDRNDLIALGLGMQLLECWAYKLKNEFPEYKFNIILRYSDNDGQVLLRFHKVREDEASWLDKNLESYKFEGIMIKQI